jgi:HlyD family secretion protein
MSHPISPPSRGSLNRRQQWILSVIVLVALFLTWGVSRRRSKSGSRSAAAAKAAASQGPLTATVASRPFVEEVVERGEVASSENVEIRCMVQSKSALGTAIIEIVPEGTYVEKGDFLVKLDDSALQAELVQQRITCHTARALLTEARAEFEAADLAFKEYESGTFKQELGVVESERFVAQENLRRAEEYLRYSMKLASRGYVTEVQLEADRFAVEKARKEFDNATTKLDVLHRFTKVKTINRLKASVETAGAKLQSRENSNQLEEERLKNLESQLQFCVITAPTSGQVVYANPVGVDRDPLIAEGKLVRERQIIIRLPDPRRMQVMARINESRIDRVKIGMPARIQLDAFPNRPMWGTVRAISEYPLPPSSVYSTIKEYAAEISIDDPQKGVRTGMTAQVAVEVKRVDQALQVPVQAVLERGKKFFCILSDPEGSRILRKVSVDSSNGQNVIIKDGLALGEEVLLAPHNYESEVTFPEGTPAADTAPQRPPKSKLAAVDPVVRPKANTASGALPAAKPAGKGATP